MKGWHKHGVCKNTIWSAKPGITLELDATRSADAADRPLGAYYRVNHRDLICMHAALTEVGVLYASAEVHSGWDEVGADGIIPLSDKVTGGHAFAIVGYDRQGFWIQNSWGRAWGKGGFCRIGYDDWLTNGSDVWVARLGVPIAAPSLRGTAAIALSVAGNPLGYTHDDLRPHLIGIGNHGLLRPEGTFGSTEESVREIFEHYISEKTARWKKKRILLYAHGGLVSEDAAIQTLAENRETLLENEIYPISLVWKTDYWTTLANILRDALSRRTVGGVLDSAKDFMLDRLDDALEPLARILTGKSEWTKMKENAIAATANPKGGARLALQHLAALARQDNKVEVHLIGHSAGAIFHAPLVQLYTSGPNITSGPLQGSQGYGLPIQSCTLWAPACTTQLFKETYRPALTSKAIADFALFTLKDTIEQDDNCANIYHKSLLYLVSNAFEDKVHIPFLRPDGEPILGMEKFIRQDRTISALFKAGGNAEWILAPNNEPPGSPRASNARHHGDFDNDPATLSGVLARIKGFKKVSAPSGPQSAPVHSGQKTMQRLANLASTSRTFRVEL